MNHISETPERIEYEIEILMRELIAQDPNAITRIERVFQRVRLGAQEEETKSA